MIRLMHGDCKEKLRELEPESVHGAVIDAPYGLGREPDPIEVMKAWVNGEDYHQTGGGFMGHEWDAWVPQPSTWREVLRVMKPGAHALVCAGARTFGWMMLAMRCAGFEMRTSIRLETVLDVPILDDVGTVLAWMYGSGMPMGTSPAKVFDRRAGHDTKASDWTPQTEEAKRVAGTNTELKPAWEPILLMQKPFKGSVSDNMLKHGVGALYTDRCRIGSRLVGWGGGAGLKNTHNASQYGGLAAGEARPAVGGWPANVLFVCVCGDNPHLPGCPAGEIDLQSGVSKSTAYDKTDWEGRGADGGAGRGGIVRAGTCAFTDSGGASRFFYIAKPSKSNREFGTEVLERGTLHRTRPGKGSMDKDKRRAPVERGNSHPTVKPISLMQYLIRLVVPEGGTVLDPFMGSGTTGIAAVLDGFSFVGCELMPVKPEDPNYFAIAEARIEEASRDLYAMAMKGDEGDG
jgi:DNA modification methylase